MLPENVTVRKVKLFCLVARFDAICHTLVHQCDTPDFEPNVIYDIQQNVNR